MCSLDVDVMLFSAYVWGRTTWHEASFVYITQVCSVSVRWRNARGVLLLKTVPRYYPCHHIRFILSSGLGNIYGNIMTSTEFRGSNAFHYTQEKRKVTCMLYYLRKAFKAGIEAFVLKERDALQVVSEAQSSTFERQMIRLFLAVSLRIDQSNLLRMT